MKTDQLGPMTKKSLKYVDRFFPIATVLGIFEQIYPKNKLETLRSNYRHSISTGLPGPFFCIYAVAHYFWDVGFCLATTADILATTATTRGRVVLRAIRVKRVLP